MKDVTCVSYEQLARDRQLGGDVDYLKTPLADFALVVVDEAQNYRNPSAPARAGVLRQVLSGPRRDLLLLSATPVNNSLFDLYHLLRYFMKNDAALADQQVVSLRKRFQEAERGDPFNLNPELFLRSADRTMGSYDLGVFAHLVVALVFKSRPLPFPCPQLCSTKSIRTGGYVNQSDCRFCRQNRQKQAAVGLKGVK